MTLNTEAFAKALAAGIAAYEAATPDEDGWIRWPAPGPCPLPDGTKHEVKFRNGCTSSDDCPESWIWHTGTNIIAYRLAK